MKNGIVLTYIFLGLLFSRANSQNVGVNNSDPKTALDINGGLSTRTKVISPSGNAVTIPANASFVVVSGGAATGTISCLYPSAYIDGQRMVIYNSNSGGYDLDFLGTKIPLNQGREFICGTLTGWVLISGSLSREGWGLKGNAGTDTSVNFIGTTDDQPLKFKVNNQPAGLIDANTSNTALGAYAHANLNDYSSAIGNVAIGANALFNDTSGNRNTAVGFYAMEGTKTSGSQNTAVGSHTLTYVQGVQNSAFGSAALEFLRIGSFNTVLGAYAYANTTSGTGNTAVGVQSMYGGGSFHSISGNYNTAVGMLSLKNNIIGNGAVAIGHQAAFSDTAAEGIVAIGRAALYYNNGKMGNVAIGDSSLFNNNNGTLIPLQAIDNVAIGNHTLFSNTNGFKNTAIGAEALYSNIGGYFNLANGFRALNRNTEGYSNTAVGAFALVNNTVGNDNVALGRTALQQNTKGNSNSAIGTYALDNNISGNGNSAVGYRALHRNTIGNNNSALGDSAVYSNLSGFSNVAIGSKALKSNTILSNLVAIGDSALFNAGSGGNGFGKYNTAVGSKALFTVVGSDVNTAVGYNALRQTNGAGNTAIGAFAGTYVNGNFNTIIGSQNQTYTSPKNISGAVFIGIDAGLFESTSNKLYIENSDANKANALIYGDFAADSLNLNAKVSIRDFTRLGTQAGGAPAIKMKKFTGTSSSSQNGFTDVTHGLNRAKIIGVQVIMKLPGFVDLGPGSRVNSGYEYEFQILDSIIRIANLNGNSANILSKNFVVLVTYEE